MIVSKPSRLREDYKCSAGSPLQIKTNTPDWFNKKKGYSLPSNSIQGLDSCTLFNILNLAKQLDLKLIPQLDSKGANFIYFFYFKKSSFVWLFKFKYKISLRFYF